MLMTLMAVPLS